MTTTATPENFKRTRIITLSLRRPIQIIDEDWVEVAKAGWSKVGYGSRQAVVANSADVADPKPPVFDACVRVRQYRPDKKSIVVYATYDSNGAEGKDQHLRTGILLNLEDSDTGWEQVVRAISTSLLDLSNLIPESQVQNAASVRGLIPVCVADLPAEDKTEA